MVSDAYMFVDCCVLMSAEMQGVIVAAPVYAATGSRWKAMGIATASVSRRHLLLMCWKQSFVHVA